MTAVPFIGPRSRYNVLNVTPTWIVHRRAAGDLNGVRPITASEADPDKVDPDDVVAGRAEWTNLTGAGLFHDIAKFKRPVLIEAVDGAAAINAATTVRFDVPATTVRDVKALLQATPFVPFVIAAGEMLKITTTAQVFFGVLVSINEGIEQVF